MKRDYVRNSGAGQSSKPLFWPRTALVGVSLVFLSGCFFSSEQEESPPETGSPVETDPAFTAGPGQAPARGVDSLDPALESEAATDTTRAGEVTAGVAADTIPAEQDTVPGPQENVLEATDPISRFLAEDDPLTLSQRVLRLEAENDSLRAAVGTLLTFLTAEEAVPQRRGPGSPQTAPPADSVENQQDLIAVDAQQVQNWGLRAAVAIFFLLLTGLFIRVTIWVLEKLAERNAKRRLLFKRLVPIARISFWFLSLLFVFMVVLRVDAQGLIAAGAAVGVAIGFAAQDILKNIFGGLIVLFDQPFQVGDKISVGGTYGEVVSIGLRSTRIVTPDDNLVSVPNAQVVDGQVANANAGELNCQVVTDLFLPGWVDETKAKRIAFEAATSSKYVFLNKPVVVLVKDEFRETFLTQLRVKAYVLDPRYEFLFMSDVTERARAGFRKAGLLGPMHGVRAYVDLNGHGQPPDGSENKGEEGP